MSVARFGGFLIGGILLATGLAIVASDMDPLVLCFKQCDIPKALGALLGPNILRALIGGFFFVLAALFLLPKFGAKGRIGKPE